MPKITILFGLLLCTLSAITLVISQELKSPTALIPLGFGIPLLVLGVLAARGTEARKHYMHAAVTIGLVGGILALGRGIVGLVKIANGGEVPALAAGMVWTMAVICFIFVGLCVQSFIAARKAREATQK